MLQIESTAAKRKHISFEIHQIHIIFMYLTGTAGIIMAAPSHYDARKPIDVQYSKIDEKSDLKNMMKNAAKRLEED